jgi:hypothetical protein
VGTAALVVTVAVRRGSRSEAAAWACGLLVAAAALFYWWRPLGSTHGWAGTLVAPQLLVFAGLGVLVALTLEVGRSKRPFQRIEGSSTTR